MTDYIKREDAEGTIRYFFSADNLFIDKGAEVRRLTNKEKCDEAFKYIEHLSSADVAPVRHGRWIVGERMPMYDIKGNLSWGNWYTCNQCEFKTYAIEGHITQYRYCPNCGAKMDEG